MGRQVAFPLSVEVRLLVVCNGEQWPTWQIDAERSVGVFLFLGIPIPTQSLHMCVSGSFGISSRTAFYLARKRTPLMYQPALLSSPAKLLLGCISITISQSSTTLVLDHSGPIFRRLVCRSPQIQFLRAASSLLYLKGTRNNLNEEEDTSCDEELGLIAVLVVLWMRFSSAHWRCRPEQISCQRG